MHYTPGSARVHHYVHSRHANLCVDSFSCTLGCASLGITFWAVPVHITKFTSDMPTYLLNHSHALWAVPDS
eukprot:7551423-Karenia_brevis.AAC.1